MKNALPDVIKRSGLLPGVMRGRLLALTGLLVLLWVAMSWSLGAVADGRACTEACHAMKPYAEAASDSTHPTLTCRSCHVGEKPLDDLSEGLALQRRAIAQVSGRTPEPGDVMEANCRRCHVGILRGTLSSSGIAVRHSDFSETPCTRCHGGTGHEIAGGVYARPQMDDCLECHTASAREPGSCSRCHVGGGSKQERPANSWRITHGPEWRSTHGMGELRTCVSCHTPDYCSQCHGVALPHPVSWNRQHGKQLDATGISSCHTCHDEKWCTGCHGVKMPHEEQFLPAHGPTAEKIGTGACYRCHAKPVCDECHYRSSHPDIPVVGRVHTGPL